MSDGDVSRLWIHLENLQKGQSQMLSDLARMSERGESFVRELSRQNEEIGVIKGRVTALEACAAFMESVKERVAKVECTQAERTCMLTQSFRTIDARLNEITLEAAEGKAVSKFKASLLMACGSLAGGLVVVAGNLLVRMFGG